MFTTPRRIWNRLTRRRATPKRMRHDRLPLRMESLEVRDVPATLFALTEAPNQQLLIFNSATPGAAVAINVNGLSAGESLVGIDFRPANEQLYGISNVNSKLYQINTGTGAVTLVGSFGVMPVASSFGLDFNPVVDRVRYTGDTGVNLRINPNTGALAANDPGINGATTGLDGVAYTNNFFGATTTQLFGINSNTDTLYEVTAPNLGTTVAIGAGLGVDTDGRLGFDIAADDGIAYAAMTVGGVAKLYTIDLATGTATVVGQIGLGGPLVGLSAQPVLNNNPVVTFSGVTQTFDIQSDIPVQIDPAATVQDPDTTSFNTGTLLVSPVAGVAGDVISIQNQGTGAGQVSITGSNVFFQGVLIGMFTDGSDVLPLSVTFNGSATLAAVQAVLRAATFSTTDNSLVPNTRMFNATVTDGAGGSGTTATPQTVNLADLTAPTVVSINRDTSTPTNATTVSYTVIFSEAVTGVDATDFAAVFTGVASASVMTVTQNTASNYTVTVDVGAGGSGTVRLDTVNDGTIMDLAGNVLSGTFMGQVYDIDRINPDAFIAVAPGQPDPAFSQPVVFFVSFTEPVFGFDVGDLQLSGTAGGMLTATIKVLNATDFNIEVSGATSDGTIVLNIPAGGVTDAAGNTNNKASTLFGNTVFVNVVNDPPVITAPAAINTNEDTEFAFTGANTVSVDDPDLNNGDIQITLTATNGTVRLGSTTNLTFITGDGSAAATMTFKGQLADVNAALATLFFNPTANFTGAAAVDILADDLGNTGSGGAQTSMATVAVTVDPVNDGPSIAINNTPFTTAENAVLTFTAGTFVITDVDADPDDIEVTLTATNGTLTFGSITGLTFTTGDGTDDATMTFTGTLAAINAALDTLSFNPTANFNGTANIAIDVDDLGHNGTGGPLTAMADEDITVTPVNTAPTITAPATATTPEDTQLVFSGANLISIADVDAGTGSLQVTLEALHGTITLSGITGLTFTTGDGTGDAKMVFKGTLANINTALNGLKYNPTLNFNGADTLGIDVDDLSGGGNATATFDVAITVTPANDAPTAVNSSFSTKQNTTLVVNPPGILTGAVDPEGTPLSAVLVTNVPAGSGTLTFTGGNGTGNGGFTFVPAPNFVGTVTFTFRASDGTLQSNLATVTITVTENFTRLFATGAGEGGGPQVVAYNSDGSTRFSFYAFDEAFAGGVRVATGDVNGDGVEDILCAAGPGGTPHIRVLSGTNLVQIHSFMAYDPAFGGGVFISSGDVNGDGFADIITGAGAGGGPHVRVFNGKTGAPIQDFFAYDADFLGGVSVASADYSGDGKSDIVTGAGPGGTPHVIVFQGGDSQILKSFFAFDPNFTGGVNVAAGEFNDEPAIFTAAGSGGVPVVSIYDFATTTQMAAFFAFDESQGTGVSIATEVATNGDTTIFVGSGRDFAPTFRALDADTLAEEDNFNAYSPEWLGGVWVG